MKIQPDPATAQSISSYGAGWVRIGAEKISHSLVISSSGVRQVWPCSRFADLQETHFAPLANMGAELVIFGSGHTLRFPQAAWIRPLIEKQIGVETMDAHTACRTYNILAFEGRQVVLALLQEAVASGAADCGL